MFKTKISLFINITLLSAISIIVFAFCIESLNHIIHFNGYAANGAFQLMNPLTRLADNQIIGRDFQFFHGAGVALVHYPLFELFGEGLFGSEMSRWFTSIILFVVSGFLFCYTWFNRSSNRMTVSLLSFLLVFLLSALFAEVITPSNSLLGVRTTVPILIGTFLLTRNRIENKYFKIKNIKIYLFKLILGFLLALAILCGTEHGIAAVLAFFAVELAQQFVLTKQKTFKNIAFAFCNVLLRLLPTLAYTLIVLLTTSAVISFGNPFTLLHYALVIVPNDQFWYFGSDPQGYLKLNTLAKQLIDPAMLRLYIIAVCSMGILYAAKRLKLLTRNEWLVVTFLISYGTITLGSLLGYYVPTGQLAAILRTFILVDSIVATLIIVRFSHSHIRYVKILPALACIFILVAAYTLSIAKLSEISVKQTLRDTYHNLRGDHSSLLGTAWTERINQFNPYIDDAKKHNHAQPLWSTYSSLYEQQNGTLHPSSNGCDYIIHCLGNNMRTQYTQDFVDDQPELVTTLRQSYFGYEEWLWGRHADFYQHLVDNYEIISKNDAHILWRRTSAPPTTTQSRQLIIENSSIILPSSSTAGSQVIKVSIEYKTDKKWSKLPFVNKIPRYVIHPTNTVSKISYSVPPSEHAWSFLVVLNDNSLSNKQTLDYTVDGLLPRSHMTVSKATYMPIHTDENERAYFTEKSIFLE